MRKPFPSQRPLMAKTAESCFIADWPGGLDVAEELVQVGDILHVLTESLAHYRPARVQHEPQCLPASM